MKRVAPMPATEPATQEHTEPSIRILKIATCPSLSGKTTLKYHIGCNADSDIQFRLFDSSGNGFFSKDWIALNAIQEIIDKLAGRPITSHIFNPLFLGKSVNTAGFLLAVLLNESLLAPMQDKPRCYERKNIDGFISGIEALIASGVNLKIDDKPPAKATAPKGKKSAVSAK